MNQAILNWYGINKSPEIDEKVIQKVMRVKKDLERLTRMKIEKAYICGESYWGKDSNENTIGNEVCFLIDEKTEMLNSVMDIVQEYAEKRKNRNIIFYSLCQFVRKSQSTIEPDYYISHYGKLVYDSKKEIEKNEKVDITQYAKAVQNLKYTKKYLSRDVNSVLMRTLMEIYLLKIGYFVWIEQEKRLTFSELKEYLYDVTDDVVVRDLLKKYEEVMQNDEERNKVCREFEKYLQSIKKTTISYKLPNEPTMRVYEKKKEQWKIQGPLDIATLTKEELYTMYIIQGKQTAEIAELYNVSNRRITNKRNYWKIKQIEEAFNAERMIELQQFCGENNLTNLLIEGRQIGLLDFESCIEPILSYMKTGEKCLLKEFWSVIEPQKMSGIIYEVKQIENNWLLATLCIEFLKDNGLVKEVDFKKYKITKLGRKLVEDFDEHHEIDLLWIGQKLGSIRFFRRCL